MIRKAVIVGLSSLAAATALVWLVSWIVPLYSLVYSDDAGQAYSDDTVSFSVYVEAGETKVMYRRIEPSSTVRSRVRFSHVGVRWVVQYGTGHGGWTGGTPRPRRPGHHYFRSYIPPDAVWVPRTRPATHTIAFPMRLPFALFALAPATYFAAGVLRRWRRRQRGECVACGYNLTGNVSGVCPECGTPR